jgi:hypothetical protein
MAYYSTKTYGHQIGLSVCSDNPTQITHTVHYYMVTVWVSNSHLVVRN